MLAVDLEGEHARKLMEQGHVMTCNYCHLLSVGESPAKSFIREMSLWL